MFKKTILTTAIALILAGCGGGGGGSSSGSGATTATGQFKDSNTAGLNYTSGGQSGITGADGSFTFEVGNNITFSIGGVTLGTTLGKSIVTPVDLVPGGSSSSTAVQNLVRFLMMLDSDANPSNGINISPSVLNDSRTWSQIDFNDSNFSTSANLAEIRTKATGSDGGTHVLPAANAAKTHLESTLLCSYAGAYTGTYSAANGDPNANGNFGILVDALTGSVTGVAYNTFYHEYFGLSGNTPVSKDQRAEFVTGNATNGATFQGQFGGQSTSVDGVSGTWMQNPYNGNFRGARIGGAKNAVYRFTGNYSGSGNFGLFSFDIDSTNAVTGISYNIAADEEFTLSGAVSGISVSGTASDGTAITGTLNTTTGSLIGEWNNSAAGVSGVFSGSGCKLN